MFLDRVTITGADDSVTPADLLKLSLEHPWVEWGILVSKTREGGPRFPSREWVRALTSPSELHGISPPMRFALHVCGRWVRQLMLGEDNLFREWGDIGAFYRVQLNFHAQRHEVKLSEAAALFFRTMAGHQVIVQMDGTENAMILSMLRTRGIDAVPLYDTSGGAGVVPGEWPLGDTRVEYQGYAGGLGPETLERELPRIAEAADGAAYLGATNTRIWIDMERRVRSDDDTRFDLDKVRRCLEICAPLVRA